MSSKDIAPLILYLGEMWR